MQISRFTWDGEDARSLAGEIRGQQPALSGVADDVAVIIAEVRAGGDAALAEIEARFGDVRPSPADLRQPDEDRTSELGRFGRPCPRH